MHYNVYMNDNEYYDSVLGTCHNCPHVYQCNDFASSRSCKTVSERATHVQKQAEGD